MMLDATLAVIQEMLIIGVFDQSKNSGEYKAKNVITIINNEPLVKQQKKYTSKYICFQYPKFWKIN